jgi:transposase InsO family protein
MGEGSVTLSVGSRLLYDGDLVEVIEFDGAQVTVRVERTNRFRTLGIGRLVTACKTVDVSAGDGATSAVGTALAALTTRQRAEVTQRAGHVREVMTGFRSGHPHVARPDEPRPEYAATVPVKQRYRAKADELGVNQRTVERWVAGYRQCGEAGLIDTRQAPRRGSQVDPRWDEAARLVLADLVRASTPSQSAVLAAVDTRLDETGGERVPRPSRATAYRRLAELTKGSNAVRGSAKGRRSIADRPHGVYGRLRATRPGEYLILDTQDLDVFAMEAVTCRWVRVQLTVAQCLFTRCIVGLRVTPVSTKAVDVAGVLYDAIVPQPAPAGWPVEAAWPYHGVPSQVVFDEYAPMRGPVCAPETLVVDHGKVFLSAHVIGVCTRLGISIQPAQPRKPTDKPTVERFFKTLREGLIQHLPAYKGPDVYSRGERVEDDAFLFVHEVEDAIREWVACVYHRASHDGLCVPEWPGLELSPAQMFAVGVGKAGLLRIPATPELAYDFLPVAARTIQHYGVEVNGLRYNGPGLDGYRNTTSPYGGALAGKWPIRVNPDDVRHAWFCDPADGRWHRLDWEHAAGLDAPFSGEAARHARRLAAAGGGHIDPAEALSELLGRWRQGVVSDRRERRIAVRLAAEYAALPAAVEPATPAAALGAPPAAGRAHLQLVAEIAGDDDDSDDLAVDEDDFYADAFEVIE